MQHLANITPTDLFRHAVKLAEAGETDRAQDLIVAALKIDSSNARAWLWLGALVNSPEEQRYCIDLALEIDPDVVPPGHSLPFNPGPARRPARFNEPGKPLDVLLAPPRPRTPPAPRNRPPPPAPRPCTPLSDAQRAEIAQLSQRLAADPARLGRWLGYGARLAEEIG